MCTAAGSDPRSGRDVAQFGSAPDWGSGGRRFKSGRPDLIKVLSWEKNPVRDLCISRWNSLRPRLSPVLSQKKSYAGPGIEVVVRAWARVFEARRIYGLVSG